MENDEDPVNRWWNGDSCAGGGELIKTCLRDQHKKWTLAFAQRVLQGYRQFLDLKKAVKDWDGTMLEPPPVIRMIWQAHVLNTKTYFEDCKLLVGRIVHYVSFGERNEFDTAKRVFQTKLGVKSRSNFEDFDDDIWWFDEEYKENVMLGRNTTQTHLNLIDDHGEVEGHGGDDKYLNLNSRRIDGSTIEESIARGKGGQSSDVDTDESGNESLAKHYLGTPKCPNKRAAPPPSTGGSKAKKSKLILESNLSSIKAWIGAAREEISDPIRQDYWCQELRRKSSDDFAFTALIVEAGGIPFLLESLKIHENKVRVVPEVCGALAGIMYHDRDETWTKIVIKEGGIDLIINALIANASNHPSRFQAMKALNNASNTSRSHAELIVAMEPVLSILVNYHRSDEHFVAEGLNMMANLAQKDALTHRETIGTVAFISRVCPLRLPVPSKQKTYHMGVIDLVKTTLSKSTEAEPMNLELIEAGCLLLQNIASLKEGAHHLQSKGIVPLLNAVIMRVDNNDVRHYAFTALEYLAKDSQPRQTEMKKANLLESIVFALKSSQDTAKWHRAAVSLFSTLSQRMQFECETWFNYLYVILEIIRWNAKDPVVQWTGIKLVARGNAVAPDEKLYVKVGELIFEALEVHDHERVLLVCLQTLSFLQQFSQVAVMIRKESSRLLIENARSVLASSDYENLVAGPAVSDGD
jgi:hypothetical protein